jgi:hypothetical protein
MSANVLVNLYQIIGLVHCSIVEGNEEISNHWPRIAAQIVSIGTSRYIAHPINGQKDISQFFLAKIESQYLIMY